MLSNIYTAEHTICGVLYSRCSQPAPCCLCFIQLWDYGILRSLVEIVVEKNILHFSGEIESVQRMSKTSQKYGKYIKITIRRLGFNTFPLRKLNTHNLRFAHIQVTHFIEAVDKVLRLAYTPSLYMGRWCFCDRSGSRPAQFSRQVERRNEHQEAPQQH